MPNRRVNKPSCLVVIGNGEAEYKKKAALGKKAARAREIKQEMDRLHELYLNIKKDIHSEIADDMGKEKTAFIYYEDVVCMVSLRSGTSKIKADRAELKKAFGDKYEYLIREKTTYSPEKKMLEIADKPDHPLCKTVRKYLEVSEPITIISFRNLEVSEPKGGE
ncbi:MAG: hypothetical protein GY749_38135 [Desulfobacteraceae bacterium]|nr:hypothetical protein [Desulfobacteraceae bacterium]